MQVLLASGGPSLRHVETATGTTSVSFSAANAGDFLLLSASDGFSGTPSLPTGWTSLYSGTGYRVAYKIAAGGETGTGAISNVMVAAVSVYRGGTPALGATATGSGSGATITLPALTLQATNGASWVASIATIFSAGTITGAPSGMTQRAAVFDPGANPVGQYDYDTNLAVAAFASKTATFELSASWRAFSIEIKTS